MSSSPFASAAFSPFTVAASDPNTQASLHVALARAARAAARACLRVSSDAPERGLWIRHSEPLLDSLLHTAAQADAEVHEAIAVQLDDIVETSRDDLELLRRLIVLTSHARDHLRLCNDLCVPAAVRRRGRALQFRLFDRIARVRRDPEIERLARRRNEVFVELGLRPRSLTLIDWCDVAVRIAQGGPLQQTLATLSSAQSERLLAAKVRFDLLAIELNIALDDLVDDGRDAGLFALTVTRVLGPVLGCDGFHERTAVGRYFLEQLAHADARLRGDRAQTYTRYLELVETLYRDVVSAGRALAGERWDDAIWSTQMRRLLGSMMLSLVENERPDLLGQADWSRDFHGPDRLTVQAANSNRVVFEIVGLWCHEHTCGRSMDDAAKPRVLGAFEELQISQQLANCLATLDRELDEGDRSNSVVARAIEAWAELSAVQRANLVQEADLSQGLQALSISVPTHEIIEALYERLQGRGKPQERALAIQCLRLLIERTGAVGQVLEQWWLRVDAAAELLESLGLCGTSSRQAQIDLLLLHLALLKKSPLADSGERH